MLLLLLMMMMTTTILVGPSIKISQGALLQIFRL
jgi:hypothetical protein